MKKRITKIWGVSLVVALLASLLVMGAPASAYVDNAFQEEDILYSSIYQLASGTDVTDFAVYGDGSVIWLVNGTDNYTYKSTNGGATWVKGNTSAFSNMTPDLIAIAPDNANIVVAADVSSKEVYLTTNGGVVWDNLPDITGINTLKDLAVSPTASGINYIAVSGNTTSKGAAWFFNTGAAAPTWYDTATGSFADATMVDAIAFSPNFPSDLVMVAVSSNISVDNPLSDNVVKFQIMSYSGAPSSWSWNSAPFPTGSGGYPVTMVTGLLNLVTGASIALDTEYLGSDDVLRNAFVGLSLGSTDAADTGVYRLEDTVLEGIKLGSATSALNIQSVAYDGVTLVAAEKASSTVWRSSDPMASVPTFYPSSSLKSPSGGTTGTSSNTVLAWGGGNLFAGTSGANSAFSISRNDGKSFNDISFIDTTLADADDIAVAADASSVYWVTNNGTYLSVWYSTGVADWERVLTLADTNYIIRLAPDNAKVAYVADKGGSTVYYTKDAGAEKWYTRTCTLTGGITDLTVESADVAYAVNSGGAVSKSTNSGFTWGPPVNSKVSTGYTITSVSQNNLLVGGAIWVSYSTDGGDSFTKIALPVTAASNLLVVADKDFATNKTLYAATSAAANNIWRWVIGTSTAWEDTFYGSLAATESVYGLKVVNGTLYALSVTTTDNQSHLWQCTAPSIAKYTDPWWWASESTIAGTDSDNTTQVQLGKGSASNNALVGSTGSNKLWAVMTNGPQKLYSYKDVLASSTPEVTSPADKFSDPVNTVTGRANEVTFTWPRVSNATAYEICIYYDEALKSMVTFLDFNSTSSTVSRSIGPDKETTGISGYIAGNPKVNFMPGTTYYWSVQAIEPLYSQSSATRSFTIQPGVAMVPTIGSPINGGTVTGTPAFSWSPVSGTTKYEFQLSEDANFATTLVTTTLTTTGIQPSVTLDAGKTYFWRVRALEPVKGDWSTIANFTIAVPAPAPAPPVVVKEVPAPVINIPPAPPAQEIVIPPAPAAPAPISTGLLYAVIIIGAVLVIAVIVLIVRTRRAV